MLRGRYNDAAGGWPFRSTQCLQKIFLMLIAIHYINISLSQYSNFVTKLCGGGGSLRAPVPLFFSKRVVSKASIYPYPVRYYIFSNIVKAIILARAKSKLLHSAVRLKSWYFAEQPRAYLERLLVVISSTCSSL